LPGTTILSDAPAFLGERAMLDLRSRSLKNRLLELITSPSTNHRRSIRRYPRPSLVELEPMESRTHLSVVMVKDINLGGGGSEPDSLVNVNGTLFFRANDGASGPELWKSDGSAASTVLVKNINPSSGGSSPDLLTNVNGTLFFSADDDSSFGRSLWKSDGTTAGTVILFASTPNFLANVDGRLFLSANSSAFGRELWKSDGTVSGTDLVKDIFPGALSGGNSDPIHLTNVNGTLFFNANDGESGHELWKSDGTAAGTVLVKDIFPGSDSSYPEELTAVGSTLFFIARDGATGSELWKSDGTAAGTVMVKDILSGDIGSAPSELTNVNGTLFFSANDGVNGVELWKSDGTAAGTVMVKDIRLGLGSGSNPTDLTNVNGTLFFTATDGVNGYELWKSDGSADGTVRVKDIKEGVGDSSPRSLTNVNGKLYFAAEDGVHGLELWMSDGTTDGTVLVEDIAPGIDGSSPQSLTNVNGTLYFTSDDGVNGRELWKAAAPFASIRSFYDVSTVGSVRLSGSASVAVGRIVRYEWDYDFDPAKGFRATAVGSKPTFPGAGFNAPSQRTIAMRAFDDGGLVSNMSFTTVRINANPSIGSFTVSPSQALPGGLLTLRASNIQTVSGRSIDEVEIYFDANKDGKIGPNDPKLNVTRDSQGGYAAITTAPGQSGTYKYLARVKDNLGAFSSVMVRSLAVTIPPSVGTLTATPNPVSKGKKLTFVATDVSDADGTVASVSFYRDVDGDGEVTFADKRLGTDVDATNGWSLSVLSSNAYLITGVNRILAVAKDNLGAVGQATLTLVTIDAPPKISSFTASANPRASAPITLTVKGSSDITSLSIFRDNGDSLCVLENESLLGNAAYDKVSASWKLTLSANTLAPSSLRLWARADDGVGFSTPRSLSLTVGV
jgi:ELWxxDGT repeat protein